MKKTIHKYIPNLSAEYKLRQFSFKLLHRTLGLGLKYFRVKIVFFCKSPDSLEDAFLECPPGLFLSRRSSWINDEHRVNFTPSKTQILFKDYVPLNTSARLSRKFGISVV